MSEIESEESLFLNLIKDNTGTLVKNVDSIFDKWSNDTDEEHKKIMMRKFITGDLLLAMIVDRLQDTEGAELLDQMHKSNLLYYICQTISMYLAFGAEIGFAERKQNKKD